MNTTPETDALIAADLHHLEHDETCPASAYWRMANLCRDMERQRDKLRHQIRETIMENLHLADGDQCTLKRLKDAIGFDLDDENEKTPPRDGEG
jgi:hypothetical protein